MYFAIAKAFSGLLFFWKAVSNDLMKDINQFVWFYKV